MCRCCSFSFLVSPIKFSTDILKAAISCIRLIKLIQFLVSDVVSFPLHPENLHLQLHVVSIELFLDLSNQAETILFSDPLW